MTFSNRPTSARKPPGAGGGAPRACGSAATSSGIAAAKLENETEELKRKQITSSMDCSCFLQHDIVQLSYIIARSRSLGTRRSRHLAFSHRPLTLAALASLSLLSSARVRCRVMPPTVRSDWCHLSRPDGLQGSEAGHLPGTYRQGADAEAAGSATSDGREDHQRVRVGQGHP